MAFAERLARKLAGKLPEGISSVTVISEGRSVTVPASTAERRIARELELGNRLARATDRVDPETGEVLDEHGALERLIGLEALMTEKDKQIADTNAKLKLLKEEREGVITEIRAIIRIPTPAPTPLFDGEPA